MIPLSQTEKLFDGQGAAIWTNTDIAANIHRSPKPFFSNWQRFDMKSSDKISSQSAAALQVEHQ
jgi:hypothetical protein